MVCQIGMGYGVWESLVHLAGNRLGGHKKVWVMGIYGLSQVWVKTGDCSQFLETSGLCFQHHHFKSFFVRNLRILSECIH
jgi:hypothetical protein